MHELSLCQSLIDQAESIARQHGATRVERILLQVGPLSGVEPTLLQHAFPLAAAGTLAAGATLDIAPAPVRVACNDCGAESDASPNRLLCGTCASFRTRLICGDELLLARLELTLPDAPPAPPAGAGSA